MGDDLVVEGLEVHARAREVLGFWFELLMQEQRFTGVKYDGKVFDCGSKLGFLTANVVFALDRDDIRDGFIRELRKLDLGEQLEG